MRTFRRLAALALLASAVLSPAEEPQGTVYCYGDSNTANKKSYVAILDEKWKHAKLINAGRGGRKIADRDNLIALFEQRKKVDEKNIARGKTPEKIEWFFIMLAGNDLKARASDATVDKCAENMAWTIDYIRGQIPEVKILVLAPPTMFPEKMKAAGYETQAEAPRRMAAVEAAYQKLAAEKQVKFASMLNVVPAEHFPDGLHVDAAGQNMIAEAIIKAFETPETSAQPVPATVHP